MIKSFNEYKEENTPHIVQEVVCLKCLFRWLAVRPKEVLLKQLECKCGNVGYVIATGQELEDEGKND